MFGFCIKWSGYPSSPLPPALCCRRKKVRNNISSKGGDCHYSATTQSLTKRVLFRTTYDHEVTRRRGEMGGRGARSSSTPFSGYWRATMMIFFSAGNVGYADLFAVLITERVELLRWAGYIFWGGIARRRRRRRMVWVWEGEYWGKDRDERGLKRALFGRVWKMDRDGKGRMGVCFCISGRRSFGKWTVRCWKLQLQRLADDDGNARITARNLGTYSGSRTCLIQWHLCRWLHRWFFILTRHIVTRNWS